MVVRLPATMVALLAIAILLVRHERAARDRRIAETCHGWQRAIAAIQARPPRQPSGQTHRTVIEDAVSFSDMDFLWTARRWLADHPTETPKLLPFLTTPGYIGLTSDDVMVKGRDRPDHGYSYVTSEDLFMQSGRASWLLQEVTGREGVPHAIVGSNPIMLADLDKDWRAWFDDLDGGRACFESPSR
jgi:hypothetical protein